MKIALYENPGLIGWAIKWRTWGRYTHAAHVLSDGGIIEARMPAIRYMDSPQADYGSGTVIDIYEVDGLTDEQAKAVERRAWRNVGRKYDWCGILAFVLRIPLQSERDLFCSELVFDDYKSAGVELLRNIQPYKVHPTLLSWSPKLTFVERIIV